MSNGKWEKGEKTDWNAKDQDAKHMLSLMESMNQAKSNYLKSEDVNSIENWFISILEVFMLFEPFFADKNKAEENWGSLLKIKETIADVKKSENVGFGKKKTINKKMEEKLFEIERTLINTKVRAGIGMGKELIIDKNIKKDRKWVI